MKKILSALISLALAVSSLTVAFADEKVGIDVKVTEVPNETFVGLMNGEVPGYTPYQIAISFNNLGDLTNTESGFGVNKTYGRRLGSFEVRLYTNDLDKIDTTNLGLQPMNYAEKTYNGGAGYPGVTTYGCMKFSAGEAALASSAGYIKFLKSCGTDVGNTFPISGDAESAALDRDGVLENAIVFWILASEPIEFYATEVDANIHPQGKMDVFEEHLDNIKYSFSTTATVADPAQAKFTLTKGETTKEYSFPSGLVGATEFTILVKTKEAGDYTLGLVDITSGEPTGTIGTTSVTVTAK